MRKVEFAILLLLAVNIVEVQAINAYYNLDEHLKTKGGPQSGVFPNTDSFETVAEQIIIKGFTNENAKVTGVTKEQIYFEHLRINPESFKLSDSPASLKMLFPSKDKTRAGTKIQIKVAYKVKYTALGEERFIILKDISISIGEFVKQIRKEIDPNNKQITKAANIYVKGELQSDNSNLEQYLGEIPANKIVDNQISLRIQLTVTLHNKKGFTANMILNSDYNLGLILKKIDNAYPGLKILETGYLCKDTACSVKLDDLQKTADNYGLREADHLYFPEPLLARIIQMPSGDVMDINDITRTDSMASLFTKINDKLAQKPNSMTLQPINYKGENIDKVYNSADKEENGKVLFSTLGIYRFKLTTEGAAPVPLTTCRPSAIISPLGEGNYEKEFPCDTSLSVVIKDMHAEMAKLNPADFYPTDGDQITVTPPGVITLEHNANKWTEKELATKTLKDVLSPTSTDGSIRFQYDRNVVVKFQKLKDDGALDTKFTAYPYTTSTSEIATDAVSFSLDVADKSIFLLVPPNESADLISWTAFSENKENIAKLYTNRQFYSAITIKVGQSKNSLAMITFTGAYTEAEPVPINLPEVSDLNDIKVIAKLYLISKDDKLKAAKLTVTDKDGGSLDGLSWKKIQETSRTLKINVQAEGSLQNRMFSRYVTKDN